MAHKDLSDYDFSLEANFGDARLNRRLISIVERLAAHPGESIPQAQGPWADTKATYRFWDNRRVTPQGIIESQIPATIARIEATTTDVLAIQDTTTLSYARHPAVQGLGYNNNMDGHGIHVHTTMAATDQGTPLGIVDQHTWIRESRKRQNKNEIARTPLENKESYRWLESERNVLSRLPPSVRIITIADREADITEFIVRPRREGADFLVRSDTDRRLVGTVGKLSSYLASLPGARRIAVAVGRSNKRSERTASVEVTFGEVTLRQPNSRPGLKAITPTTVRVIQAKEVGRPAGEAPIHWVLLTSMAVTSFDDACRCIRYYSYRWLIERYHYVLKSGCQIEELQLETRERIERALATYCVVAWRILYLRYAARSFPQDAPASVILSDPEWKALSCYRSKTAVAPAMPPLLRDAVIWIAQLGGFLARRSDGHPGVKVLWRGLRRLEDITAAYKIFSGAMGNA